MNRAEAQVSYLCSNSQLAILSANPNGNFSLKYKTIFELAYPSPQMFGALMTYLFYDCFKFLEPKSWSLTLQWLFKYSFVKTIFLYLKSL